LIRTIDRIEGPNAGNRFESIAVNAGIARIDFKHINSMDADH